AMPNSARADAAPAGSALCSTGPRSCRPPVAGVG
ncbi:MAG: hypothetical protein AVDCRST_MAG88-215, partial [uncultured Thermomicrobiales bacterium]